MTKVPPRSVPERDAKYMGLAWVMAGFSKDPNTQVGALIIDPKNNFPLGWGYNGPPADIDDLAFSWSRPEKYDFIVHAEENAINHSLDSLEGAHLYVTHMPCKKCMLKIVSMKIAKVFYMNCVGDPNSSIAMRSDTEKTIEIAKLGGVTLEEFEDNLGWLPDWIISLRNLGVFQIR